MVEKVFGRLKSFLKDFVVEEVQGSWHCDASCFEPDAKPLFDEQFLVGEPKDFVWCELVKKDIDHFQALKRLADKLGLKTSDVGYAGTKDRFAITAQRVSLFKPSLERLKMFSDSRMNLQKFSWQKRKIKMGYLDANHFHITVRDVDKKDAMKITHKILKTTFFPNFFGPQRFGSLRGHNVAVGKLLLKRKFKDAVWKILTDVSDKERPDVTHARKKLLKEKDVKAASKFFPHHLRLEKQLLQYLARNGDDYIGALKHCERKNVLFYVNAVQSKLFNEIVEQALVEGLDFTKKGHENGILPGYKTKFYDGRLGEIEQEILAKHHLSLQDFNITQLPYLRIKGSYRKAVTVIADLQMSCEDDEEFEGGKKLVLSFTLPSGVYATTFLENFFIFED